MHSFRRYVVSLFAALLIVAPGFAAEPRDSNAATTLVYIGTYTGKLSKGIYLSRLDPATGTLSTPELAGEMGNPSWVAIHPSHKFLYACGEYGFKIGNIVRGFSIGQDGKLTPINQQPSGGGGPCHLDIDKSGKNILVSNYGSGAVASLQIDDEGKLSEPAFIDQHPAVGAEAKPHSHCTLFDPAGHFALSCDAGIDRIYSYRYDAAKNMMAANEPAYTATAAGVHPRHLAYAPNGKFVYNINEAAMSVTAFTYDAEHGGINPIQTVSTLPQGYVGEGHSTAELVMHPSGKFLYGSNRGPDNIVGYRVDAETGKLTLIGHTSTQGKTPRSFGVDPSGHWLLAGNQGSDSIVEFKIDQSTGELSPTGTKLELGAPVCFQFIETRK
jgi:6-phosphogluconolactonase